MSVPAYVLLGENEEDILIKNICEIVYDEKITFLGKSSILNKSTFSRNYQIYNG